MKLLLTSAGLKNQTLIDEFLRLVGKPAKEIKVAYIPTAANVEVGNKDWLIDNLYEFRQLVGEVDIVDVSSLKLEQFKPRLEWANAIVVGGGMSSYLYKQIVESGLSKILPKLLEDRVYVGISAGSMVVGPDIDDELSQKYFNEKLGGGLGFVDFWIKPHMNSPYFSDRTPELFAKIFKDTPKTVYALEDSTAVKVDGLKVTPLGEGKWVEFK
ncbi:Type 1 glutamine amidotransferase-like domain-containing protein [Candidatus Saccharibacteria bacterium]|nr:Type 1 glutamine amidotransferase-like domain-containing protein [Candidatus Saccharibacteria bacterium]